jgi:ribosome-binding factor A|tara:strand:- start:9 stop:374 length:366 start_codon:yes stop_codon:yes gene_type:complete
MKGLLIFANMESTRQKKVSRLVLKELSQILNKESNNILGPIMISVTAVRISPDLAYANIYVSIFPVKEPLNALDKVKKQRSFIRKKLGERVRNQLRIVPELNFFIDDSADYAEEINVLLKK